MLKKELFEKFKKNISVKNDLAAKKILKEDAISSFNFNFDEGLLYIKSTILSEDFYNEYINKLELDTKSKSVISTYCTCDDFEKNEFRKESYCCKHLIATYYKFINEIENNNDILKKVWRSFRK